MAIMRPMDQVGNGYEGNDDGDTPNFGNINKDISQKEQESTIQRPREAFDSDDYRDAPEAYALLKYASEQTEAKKEGILNNLLVQHGILTAGNLLAYRNCDGDIDISRFPPQNHKIIVSNPMDMVDTLYDLVDEKDESSKPMVFVNESEMIGIRNIHKPFDRVVCPLKMSAQWHSLKQMTKTFMNKCLQSIGVGYSKEVFQTILECVLIQNVDIKFVDFIRNLRHSSITESGSVRSSGGRSMGVDVEEKIIGRDEIVIPTLFHVSSIPLYDNLDYRESVDVQLYIETRGTISIRAFITPTDMRNIHNNLRNFMDELLTNMLDARFEDGSVTVVDGRPNAYDGRGCAPCAERLLASEMITDSDYPIPVASVK